MSEKLQNQDLPEEQEIETAEILIARYELLLILHSSYTIEELKPIIEKINQQIKEQEGQITKSEDLGKLKFAYLIKHESHGYYQLIEFDMPKNNLQSLNSSLSLTSEVLRFLITKKKVKTAAKLKKEKALQEKLAKKKEQEIEKIITEKEEAKDKPKKETGKEKISLEDLDKKLDEILDTDEML